jgi:alkanesulfonate monooxygenase SsuD/methylene tetrahydromethanopterin reductase-like flavin-dependent oxidoreductase (luciferase family)
MPAFRPTLPPPGRLVRLGVVLDARNPAGRLAEVARMCDRVGIGAVWVDDSARPGPPPDGELDAWTVLAALAPATTRVRLGAMLLAGRRPAPLLAEMAASLAALAGDRVEVSLLAADGAPLRPYADAFAAALATAAAAGAGADATAAAARPGGRPTVAVEVGDPEKLDRDSLDWLVGVADDVLVTAADVDRVAETARELRAACGLAGREPESLGVAVRLPVSVGRTVTEARARWDAEPAFAELGPPEQAGVYGTLEQCHQRVIAFAHAGVTDLRCVLPNAGDIHDVIAQVTAMTVGTVDKLAPGAPRSPAPPPPEGWGGRPRFPGGGAAGGVRPEGSGGPQGGPPVGRGPGGFPGGSGPGSPTGAGPGR